MEEASISRSQRYKVAMTARARQRRKRRMKDKSVGGGNDDGGGDDVGSSSIAAAAAAGTAIASTGTDGANNNAIPCSPARSSTTAPPASQKTSTSTSTPSSYSRPIKSRYERSLSNSSTRRRVNNSNSSNSNYGASATRGDYSSGIMNRAPESTFPLSAGAAISKSSSDNGNRPTSVQRSSSRGSNIATTTRSGVSPYRNIVTPSSRGGIITRPNHDTNYSKDTTSSSIITHPIHNRTNNSHHNNHHKNSIDDSNNDNNNSTLYPDNQDTLSSEEIRNAANFTSIQFSCSNVGEVEIWDENDGYYDVGGSGGGGSGCCGVLGGRSGANGGSGSVVGSGASNVFMNDVWETTKETIKPVVVGKEEHAVGGIVGLLTPEKMARAGLMAPDGDNIEDEPDINGDSPTGVASLTSAQSFFPHDDPASSRDVTTWKGVQPLFHRGISTSSSSCVSFSSNKENNKVLHQAVSNRIIQPTVQLSELLSQIHRDTSTSSSTTLQRGYVTRRKNACGALKILSANHGNRIKIAWTAGVLDAISSVLMDTTACNTTRYTTYGEEYISQANTEARNRIVATLLNLSTCKKNRMILSSHKGLIASILHCIKYDDGESRQGCCTVLLYLAKTAETRPMLVQFEGLVDVLSGVIDVPRCNNSSNGGELKNDISRRYQNRFLKEMNQEEEEEEGGLLVDTIEATVTEDESSSSVSGSESEDSGSESGSGTNDGSLEDSDDENFEDDEEEDVHKDEEEEKSVGVVEDLVPKRMEICFKTLVEQDTKVENTEVDYDADPNRFLHGARLSVFACLLCLVKHKENAFDIARSDTLIQALINVSRKHTSRSHPRAIAILAHLTRCPQNSHHLVFKCLELLPMLQNATSSPDNEARKYALCAIQNLSMAKPCRAPIAHTPNMIESLTERCNSEYKEEVLAAVASLQNLSDEPANLIQFTTVVNCIGTIISIAKSDRVRMNEGVETKLTQFMAKNTLATISFWFRKIATSGAQKDARIGGAPPLHDAVLQPTGYLLWL